MAATTVEDVLADALPIFSWHDLLSRWHRKPPTPAVSSKSSRSSILPRSNPARPQPRRSVSGGEAGFAGKYQARVRLTGQVPIADEEFATVKEGAVVNGVATVVIVLVILWLALRSPQIILAVFINLVVGLAITAALGLLMVGALNLISVAFAVLFVGLGVDFGIQFSVRYRAERHESATAPALAQAARKSARR